jgi:hypothetical protein
VSAVMRSLAFCECSLLTLYGTHTTYIKLEVWCRRVLCLDSL